MQLRVVVQFDCHPEQAFFARRCIQGLIDVLESNYGGDITKMPDVVNKEAFRTS
jgi:hypothetical protein